MSSRKNIITVKGCNFYTTEMAAYNGGQEKQYYKIEWLFTICKSPYLENSTSDQLTRLGSLRHTGSKRIIVDVGNPG